MDWLAFPAAFLAAFLVSWGVNSLALGPWRRATGLHWTERARRLWTARASRSFNVMFLPFTFAILGVMVWENDAYIAFGLGVFGLLGAILGNYPFVVETTAPISLGNWTRQFPALWVLHYGFPTFALCVAVIMPAHFGWDVLVIGLAVLGVHVWLNFGLAVTLMRGLGVLGPAPERLKRIVSETSAGMGIEVRRVWLLQNVYGYAAALPSTRELIFSDRLLAASPDGEVASICVHELGHLSEDRAVMRRRNLLSLGWYPLIFIKPALALPGAWPGLVVLASFQILLLTGRSGRKLGRQMEVRADTIASENTSDPAIYARALERLHEINLIPAVMRTDKLTHPQLYDRMLAAGVTPSYDRPAPPDGRHWTYGIVPTIFGVVLGIFLSLLIRNS